MSGGCLRIRLGMGDGICNAVVPLAFLAISSVNFIIFVVIHVSKMHDRPYPWEMPPRRVKNTELGKWPSTLTDLY